MSGHTLVLGSYLPSTGGSFDYKTKARLDRALRNARCKKTTLVVVGRIDRDERSIDLCPRAKFLRRKGVQVKCLPAKTPNLEFEVRRYLKLVRTTDLSELTIIGGLYEEYRVRLIAEQYFGEAVAKSLCFIAAPGDGGGMSEWFIEEPLACAKYLPKLWQRRLHQVFGS